MKNEFEDSINAQEILPVFFANMKKLMDEIEITLNDENENVREKAIYAGIILVQNYLMALDEIKETICKDEENKPH